MALTAFQLSLPRAMQAYQLMRVGSAVLTGILLAKSYLTTADIGAWEALLFIGSFVVFTGVNGLLQGISPVYMRQDHEGKKVFLFNVFIVFGVIAVAIGLLFFFGGQWIIPLFTGLPGLEGFGWFALYLLLHIPSLPVEIFYLVKEKSFAIVTWGLAGFGLQLVVVVVPAFLGWGLTGCLQAMCLLAAGRLLWTLFLLQQYTIPRFNRPVIKSYLRLSTPMAANSFTGNLMFFFDNWLVGHWFLNPAVFAIYRYGSREFPLTLALSTALGTAMVPALSADLNKGLQELKMRNTRLLHLVMPVTILLMVFAPAIFPVVFNPAFSDAAPLFQIYLLIALSRVLLPNSILIALGDTRFIFSVGLAELVMKIVLGALFIYWWGLPGLAWSVVLAYWFEKAALAWRLWQKHGIGVGAWLNWKVYLAYSTVLLIVLFATIGRHLF